MTPPRSRPASTPRDRSKGVPWFLAATVIGLVHAGFSLFWALGGTWLLETLGTRLVEQFTGRLWLLLPVAAVKAATAVAPVLLDRAAWPVRTLTRGLAWTAAAVLVLWGGVSTVVAHLVLAGVVPSPGVDRPGMAGHAWLWDPLFLAWGATLATGLALTRRGRASRVGA